MKTIDRYIAWSFLSGYMILMGVGIAVLIVSDLMFNADEFTKNPDIPLSALPGIVFDYYFYNLPLYFSHLCGPLTGVAAAFTLGTMSRSNELVALIASGVRLPRLVVPLVAATLLVLAAGIANRELLIPQWAERIARTHDDVVGGRPSGVYCARDGNNAVLTAMILFPRTGQMRGVFIIEPDAPDGVERVIEADDAFWDHAGKTWKLGRGRRISHAPPADQKELRAPVLIEPVNEYPFTMNPEQLVLRRGTQWAGLLSVRQLNQLLASGGLPNRSTLDLARHMRMTEPLAQLLLLLLSAPAFLSRAPQNVLVAGARALMVTAAFFVVMALAQSVTADEHFTALVAWLPILSFGPLAAVLIGNVKT